MVQLLEALARLVPVLVGLWFASFVAPILVLVAVVGVVGAARHYLKRYNNVMNLTVHL